MIRFALSVGAWGCLGKPQDVWRHLSCFIEHGADKLVPIGRTSRRPKTVMARELSQNLSRRLRYIPAPGRRPELIANYS
jgi:hypothetical protein